MACGRLLTLAEIEQEYNVSQRTLFRYMKNRRLQGVKIAGKWHLIENDVRRHFLRRDSGETMEEDALEEMMQRQAIENQRQKNTIT